MTAPRPARPTELIMVDTVQGPGRLHVDRAPVRAGAPAPVIMLGHGAGGGVTAPDLVALAAALPPTGVTVVRYEQPWRVAGRTVAVLPPRLDEAWLPAVAVVRRELAPTLLVVGGRSAGARVACRTADAVGADAVVCLAFPLHPPGRPDKTRLPELLTPTVPVLVLQGERDTFGDANLVAAQTTGTGGITVLPLPGADHSFRVPKASVVGPAAIRAMIIDAVAGLVAALVADRE